MCAYRTTFREHFHFCIIGQATCSSLRIMAPHFIPSPHFAVDFVTTSAANSNIELSILRFIQRQIQLLCHPFPRCPVDFDPSLQISHVPYIRCKQFEPGICSTCSSEAVHVLLEFFVSPSPCGTFSALFQTCSQIQVCPTENCILVILPGGVQQMLIARCNLS